TDEILDLLYRYNCAATFFLTSEGIKSHPNLVLRMISEGHAIGVSTEDGSYNGISTLNDLVASFDSVNNTLYRLAKMKTHIARAPGGCASDVLTITSADANTVAASGYILWDWNIDAYDGIDSKYSAKTAYKKIISELEEIININKNNSHNNIPVIRFACADTTVNILELLLEYIYNSKAFVTKVISIYEKEINNAT
ncbi:MAG TPA: polysaccharide deacetylase family protein, partial [Bacillota bacterium]|nr:polysaccharide deacetylase family protein [Bacillota bacterium]